MQRLRIQEFERQIDAQERIINELQTQLGEKCAQFSESNLVGRVDTLNQWVAEKLKKSAETASAEITQLLLSKNNRKYSSIYSCGYFSNWHNPFRALRGRASDQEINRNWDHLCSTYAHLP